MRLQIVLEISHIRITNQKETLPNDKANIRSPCAVCFTTTFIMTSKTGKPNIAEYIYYKILYQIYVRQEETFRFLGRNSIATSNVMGEVHDIHKTLLFSL